MKTLNIKLQIAAMSLDEAKQLVERCIKWNKDLSKADIKHAQSLKTVAAISKWIVPAQEDMDDYVEFFAKEFPSLAPKKKTPPAKSAKAAKTTASAVPKSSVTFGNNEKCKTMLSDMYDAIAAIADKYGVSFDRTRKNFTYGPHNLNFKVEIKQAAFAVNGLSFTEMDKRQWKLYAKGWGLPEDALGRKIIVRDKTFTIAGLSERKSSKPIRLVDARGNEYRATTDMLKFALDRNESEDDYETL
jgi:hypothetical protein